MKVLLIDGYNLIHSHPSLSRTVRKNLEEARDELLRMLAPLCSPIFYDAVVVVFDAPSAPRLSGLDAHEGLQVVFTGRGQSADAFLRKAVLALGGKAEVEIASGDRAVIQMADTLGVRWLTGKRLWNILEDARGMLQREMERGRGAYRYRVEDRLPEEVRRALERIRRGEDL